MVIRARETLAGAIIAAAFLCGRAHPAFAQSGEFCRNFVESARCPADVCPVAMVQYETTPRPFSPGDLPGVRRVKRLSLPNAYSLSISPELAASPERMRVLRAALSRWGQVRYLESSRRWSVRGMPNDEFFMQGPAPGSDGQWALSDPRQIGAPAAFDRIKRKNGTLTRVAVLDTGIRASHPDLRARMWNGNPQHGMSFTDWTPSTDTDDASLSGHGTKVAGILAAVSNNGQGIASLGWRAKTKLIAVKIMDDEMGTCTDRLIDAIDYAVSPEQDAKILNLSASSCACSDLLGEKLKDLEEHRPDVLIVAAVNEGTPRRDIDSTPDFPASYRFRNVIAVQGTGPDGLLMPSSYVGKQSVQIAAPGQHILSTTVASAGDYDYGNGTSFAAPHVAAVAALMKSLAPTWGYAEIRTYLIDSAVRDCPSTEPRTLCGQNESDGRLNVDRATGPPIEITAPVAGTTWTHEQPQQVSWRTIFASTVCTKVDVRLSTNDSTFTAPSPLAEGVDVSAGGVTVVPPSATTEARIRIQCAGTQLDRLSEPFGIE